MQDVRTGTRVRVEVAPRIAATLDDFAAHLAAKKERDRTVDTYVREVRRFAAWLGEESTIAEVTTDSIARHQPERRSLAAATLGKALSAIRAYCRYLIRAKIRADDPTLDM